MGLHATQQVDLRSGDTVAIFGGGPIGLTIAQAALATNASPVFFSEPRSKRREMTLATGVDVVLDPGETDPIERIIAETDDGVDIAFEVAGLEQTMNQVIRCTRAGGTTTIVSLFEDNSEFLPTDLVVRERTVVRTAAFHGGPRSEEEFSITARGFAEETLEPERLVTSRIALNDIVDAGFERLLNDKSDEIRILVKS